MNVNQKCKRIFVTLMISCLYECSESTSQLSIVNKGIEKMSRLYSFSPQTIFDNLINRDFTTKCIINVHLFF